MIRQVAIKDFGEWMVKKREETHCSKSALARKIHCHYNSISRWETGCQFPPIDVAEQIVNALGAELVIKE